MFTILIKLHSSLWKKVFCLTLFLGLTVLWYQWVLGSIESESRLVYMRWVLILDILAILKFLENLEYYVAAWSQLRSNDSSMSVTVEPQPI